MSVVATTPLMLDITGQGVQTTDVAHGVAFDIDANGSLEQTAWASPGTALLAWDRNANGWIDDGSELFGSATLLSNGSRATTGFEALGQLDANLDGMIDRQDPGFESLRIWLDANLNGRSLHHHEPSQSKTTDKVLITSVLQGLQNQTTV